MYEALSLFIAYVPCVTGPLSILGSALTLTSIARATRGANGSGTNRTSGGGSQQSATFRRLMAGISIFDLIFSLGLSLGPFPMPAGMEDGMNRSYGLGRGSVQTCTLQGFLIYLGLA